MPHLGMVLSFSCGNLILMDSVTSQLADGGDEDTCGLVGIRYHEWTDAFLHNLLVVPRFKARRWSQSGCQIIRILPATRLLFLAFGVRCEIDNSLGQLQRGRSLTLVGPMDQ